jgi:ribosome maturation factor RimP
MAQMNIEETVAALVEEKIADRPDLFLVDIKMLPNRKLIILVDGEPAIGIADCAAISRFVGFKLEEDNVIEEAYNLEVSSPGIDFPLSLTRQYAKNIGRDVSLKMKDGAEREGQLASVTEDEIVIDEKIKAVRKTATEKAKKAEIIESTILRSEIAEAKVLISFK